MICVNRFSMCRHLMTMLIPWTHDKHWFEPTCVELALSFCSAPFCWAPLSMEGDSVMSGWDVQGQDQIQETFQFLSSLLDMGPKLKSNPKPPKQRRTAELDKAAKTAPVPPESESQQLRQLLLILGQLALRHERSLNLLQSTDSFIMFFRVEQTGALTGLIQESQKWHEQLKSAKPPLAPLRQHLCQWLLTDLLNRATKVAESKPGEQLHKICMEKKLINEDMSWPFLRWDPSQKALTIDSKKAISMQKMLQHLTDLIEDFREPSLVLKFQGLTTSTQQTTVPWKLQLNLRADRPHDLLTALAHSAIWTLVGTSLKPHSTQHSGLAKQLHQMMNPTKGHSKGAGKAKGKGSGKMDP